MAELNAEERRKKNQCKIQCMPCCEHRQLYLNPELYSMMSLMLSLYVCQFVCVLINLFLFTYQSVYVTVTVVMCFIPVTYLFTCLSMGLLCLLILVVCLFVCLFVYFNNSFCLLFPVICMQFVLLNVLPHCPLVQLNPLQVTAVVNSYLNCIIYLSLVSYFLYPY